MTVTDLVAVIPAKAASSRVPGKNFRPFHAGRSLVDIAAGRLLEAGLSGEQVYLSCEDPAQEAVADRHGIQFLLRDPRLCRNETPFADVFHGIVSGLPAGADVCWAQVCDPLFRGHRACLNRWLYERRRAESNYDSLVVCHPVRGYYLDHQHRPCSGWGFGPWHVPSQHLPTLYRMPFTFSVLTRRAITRCGYWVGERPLWLPFRGPAIDIDTPEDFRLAQILYREYCG